MTTSIEHVRLRVLTDEVTCGGAQIPRGEYDGYIDWEHPDEPGEGKSRMVAVQLIAKSAESGSPCEVLRFLHSRDIDRID